MAAPTYQSIGTVSRISVSTDVVIPKPSGLSVGDFMIALVFFKEGTARSVNTLSGWTALCGTSQETSIYAFSKTANSGDVAASNFTFVGSGNLTYAAGAILRITSQATGAEIHGTELDHDNVNETTKEFTTAITPRTAESLIVMAFGGWAQASSGAPSLSSYATTPTVTYTERYDGGIDDGANGIFFGVATGSYTGSTQFTSREAVVSESTQSPGCSSVIIVMNQMENGAGTAALLSTDADFFTTNGTSGTTGSAALLSVDADFFTPTSTEQSPSERWQGEPKTDTDWVNEPKS